MDGRAVDVTTEFLVIDLASEHQVENTLVTEGQVIATILHERLQSHRSKLILVASPERFESLRETRYEQTKIVHVAAHAHSGGFTAMGHDLPWADVALVLRSIVPPLRKGEQRVLVLSCCYSTAALRALKQALRGFYSGVYYLKRNIFYFDEAISAWAVFYARKNLERPASAIRERVNSSLKRQKILYKTLSRPKASRMPAAE